MPEAELRLLGPVRGRRVLELGCGAGRWAVALARSGGRVTALDLSPAQLAKAHRESSRHAVRVGWVRGDAERLPFRIGSFELVFSDWGAMTFADPRRTVAEAARVLRGGGRLVFATSSPFRVLAQDRRSDRIGQSLRYSYFGLHRIQYPEEVNFVLSYADWIDLFRRQRLEIESLTELKTPSGARTSYLTRAERSWGRRWPLESIWQLRKARTGTAGSARRSSRRTFAPAARRRHVRTGVADAHP